MPLTMHKDGTRLVSWEPTTALLCTNCRKPIFPTRANMLNINFCFDFDNNDALAQGEYFYLHKQCVWMEDVLRVNWGMFEMRQVLGMDKISDFHWGSLPEFLQQTMSTEAYTQLYNAWLPAIHRSAKARPLQTSRPRRTRSGWPSLRFAILKRDNYRCRLCGISAKHGEHVRLEVDHITPRSKGGTNDTSNLWTLCFACNRGKGTQEL